jgi:hypothetical protein
MVAPVSVGDGDPQAPRIAATATAGTALRAFMTNSRAPLRNRYRVRFAGGEELVTVS